MKIVVTAIITGIVSIGVAILTYNAGYQNGVKAGKESILKHTLPKKPIESNATSPD